MRRTLLAALTGLGILATSAAQAFEVPRISLQPSVSDLTLVGDGYRKKHRGKNWGNNNRRSGNYRSHRRNNNNDGVAIMLGITAFALGALIAGSANSGQGQMNTNQCRGQYHPQNGRPICVLPNGDYRYLD